MPPVAAFFGVVGTWVTTGAGVAAGATATASAVVVGGVVVGAVAGAAVAACTGGNIWKGALIGGIVGGTLGWGMTSPATAGAFGTEGTYGANGTATLAAKKAAADAAAKAAATPTPPGAGGGAPPPTGMTAGQQLMSSAALQGISSAYGAKAEGDAKTEQERLAIDQENRRIAGMRATPGAGTVLAPKITPTTITAPAWKPGTYLVPGATQVGAQQVGTQQVGSGFVDPYADQVGILADGRTYVKR